VIDLKEIVRVGRDIAVDPEPDAAVRDPEIGDARAALPPNEPQASATIRCATALIAWPLTSVPCGIIVLA
jgi:hypothetical protein